MAKSFKVLALLFHDTVLTFLSCQCFSVGPKVHETRVCISHGIGDLSGRGWSWDGVAGVIGCQSAFPYSFTGLDQICQL
jgi:hypothetical protein